MRCSCLQRVLLDRRKHVLGQVKSRTQWGHGQLFYADGPAVLVAGS